MVLLAALFPLALYLAVFGWINRRPRGMLVSGPWDFAGILFAASGLLLMGIPALLSSLCRTETWRDFWLLAKWTDSPIEELLELGRVLLFGSYFFLVLAVSAFLFWRRRRLTCIYNVYPSLVERVLGQTFEARHLPFVQMGNVVMIDPDLLRTEILEGEEETAPNVTPGVLEEAIRLEIDASSQMSFVSLWWTPADSLLRKEVESQLRRALAREESPRSAVGEWLMLLSSLLFFLLLLGAGALTLLRFLRV